MNKFLDYLRDNFLIVIIGIIASIIASIITFVIVDISNSDKIILSGTVIDKFHQEEIVSQRYGTINTNNGSATTQSTDITPEEFVLTVRTESGNIVKVNTDINEYYNISINSRVSMFYKLGAYTNWNYGYHLNKETWN